MRVLGLQIGQLGDQFIQLPTIRSLKQRYPEMIYTANLARKYRDAAPVLLWSDDIDEVHLCEGYNDWPTPKDRQYLSRFDHVYNGMAPHRQDDWWRYRHQTQEVAHAHGLPPNETTQIELTCPYPIKPVRSVAISPIGGGGAAHKTLQGVQYQGLVDYLHDTLGYDLVYQLTPYGWEGEVPRGVKVTNSTYEQSALIALASDFYIGVDTGMTWLMSAFKKPTLGLYSDAYYSPEFVGNIQPTNPNAMYLSARNLGEIPLDSLAQSIDDLVK